MCLHTYIFSFSYYTKRFHRLSDHLLHFIVAKVYEKREKYLFAWVAHESFMSVAVREEVERVLLAVVNSFAECTCCWREPISSAGHHRPSFIPYGSPSFTYISIRYLRATAALRWVSLVQREKGGAWKPNDGKVAWWVFPCDFAWQVLRWHRVKRNCTKCRKLKWFFFHQIYSTHEVLTVENPRIFASIVKGLYIRWPGDFHFN